MQQLNETGQLTLDLAPRIAGLPNEDNRHIADMVGNQMTVHTAGALGPVARVRIEINHKGDSTETLNGHTYSGHYVNTAFQRATDYRTNSVQQPIKHRCPQRFGRLWHRCRNLFRYADRYAGWGGIHGQPTQHHRTSCCESAHPLLHAKLHDRWSEQQSVRC